MFSFHRGTGFSLTDFAVNLFRNLKINISKQSLHDRFNGKAVAFLKDCLGRVLAKKLGPEAGKSSSLSHFNRVRIKDSTRFALPDSCAEKYRGYGGALHNSRAMISIQYEYDLLSGRAMDLRLTDGRKNDQSDSRDFTGDIQKSDLFIRDLGYSTLGYMARITDSGAYFLNRLAPNVNAYPDRQAGEPIDFDHYLKKIQKHSLPYIELDVYLGKKDRIPSRLVIMPTDDRTYEKRIRKTGKQSRSHGNKMSDSFKKRASMSIYVTNIDRQTISASKIRDIYSLRWQIELVFKVWKSQIDINGVKDMKMERFECELIAKLIWVVLSYHLFSYLTMVHYRKSGTLCSVWKYFKLTLSMGEKVLSAFHTPSKLMALLKEYLSIPIRLLKLEKKNNNRSLYQSFILVN